MVLRRALIPLSSLNGDVTKKLWNASSSTFMGVFASSGKVGIKFIAAICNISLVMYLNDAECGRTDYALICKSFVNCSIVIELAFIHSLDHNLLILIA